MVERQHFEDDLRDLTQRLLHMGGLVEERLHEAVRCLMERRADRVPALVAADAEVNDLQIEIDDRCLKLLALQNPFAKDLRFIAAAMKMNAELERMADQAVNIAQTAARLSEMPPLKAVIDLPHMAEIAQGMTRDSLDAFVRKDSELARAVLQRDEQYVDRSKGRPGGDLTGGDLNPTMLVIGTKPTDRCLRGQTRAPRGARKGA